MNFFKSLNNFFGIDGPTLQDMQEVEDNKLVPVVYDHPIMRRKEFQPSGETESYVPAFCDAGMIAIRRLILEGNDFIHLTELYSLLGAINPPERTGVRHAVRYAKDENYICKVLDKDGYSLRGVYRVVK